MSIAVSTISIVIQVYEFLLFIRVLLSWISIDPRRRTIDHPAVRLLGRITDPVLMPLRRLIPPIGGAVDISPIVAIFILEAVRRLLTSLLLRL